MSSSSPHIDHHNTPVIVMTPAHTIIDSEVTYPASISIAISHGEVYDISEVVSILEAHASKHPPKRRLKWRRFPGAIRQAFKECMEQDKPHGNP